LDHHGVEHSPADPLCQLRFLYGANVAIRFPVSAPVPIGRGPAELVVTRGAEAPPGDWQLGEPIYVDAPIAAPGLRLYPGASGWRLHFPRAGDFYMGDDSIHLCPAADGDAVLAENFLLGPVLSLWLERRGIRMLHAAVCAVDGYAVAFLALSQSGKTSLAAALMQAGAALLSDDLLALERVNGDWVARAGYPQMRMWPEQVNHFLGEGLALDPVHPLREKLRVPVGGGFGRFQVEALPLRAIYLPERRPEPLDAAVEFQAASPGSGLMELVRHSFLNRLVHAVGIQPQRFPLLADITRAVPIRRISYPSGMAQISAVAEAVLSDVRGLTRGR